MTHIENVSLIFTKEPGKPASWRSDATPAVAGLELFIQSKLGRRDLQWLGNEPQFDSTRRPARDDDRRLHKLFADVKPEEQLQSGLKFLHTTIIGDIAIVASALVVISSWGQHADNALRDVIHSYATR